MQRVLSVFSIILIWSLSSCSPKNKSLTYFNNIPDSIKYVMNINNKTEPKIKPDDVLSIKVSTLSEASNALFNAGVLERSAAISNNTLSEGYKVDKDGNINFPILGKISLIDKTLEEAQAYLTQKISTEVKDPIVNVRFLNAQVTVLGEVGSPGVVNISERKTSILEALGKAGDITATGRKDNVLLMRENGGKREIVRINMNDKSALSSPYFYLQQNDVVLVEPTARKERLARGMPSAIQLTTLSLSIISVVITIIIRLR